MTHPIETGRTSPLFATDSSQSVNSESQNLPSTNEDSLEEFSSERCLGGFFFEIWEWIKVNVFCFFCSEVSDESTEIASSIADRTETQQSTQTVPLSTSTKSVSSSEAPETQSTESAETQSTEAAETQPSEAPETQSTESAETQPRQAPETQLSGPLENSLSEEGLPQILQEYVEQFCTYGVCEQFFTNGLNLNLDDGFRIGLENLFNRVTSIHDGAVNIDLRMGHENMFNGTEYVYRAFDAVTTSNYRETLQELLQSYSEINRERFYQIIAESSRDTFLVEIAFHIVRQGNAPNAVLVNENTNVVQQYIDNLTTAYENCNQEEASVIYFNMNGKTYLFLLRSEDILGDQLTYSGIFHAHSGELITRTYDPPQGPSVVMQYIAGYLAEHASYEENSQNMCVFESLNLWSRSGNSEESGESVGSEESVESVGSEESWDLAISGESSSWEAL